MASSYDTEWPKDISLCMSIWFMYVCVYIYICIYINKSVKELVVKIGFLFLKKAFTL